MSERHAAVAEASRHQGVDVRAATTLARWLDECYVDPILGFVWPGFGDALGSVIGLFVVAVAARRRLPPAVLARMLLNLAADAAVGCIPLVGDAFDVLYRANLRNARLLEERAPASGSRPSDWLILGGACLAFLAVLALPIALGVWATMALLRLWQ